MDRGPVSDRHPASDRVGDAIRDRDQPVGRNGNPLARTARAQIRHHALPWPPVRNAEANALHYTRNFPARRERQRGLSLVFPPDHQRIEIVERRRANPHDHLAGTRHRIRQFLDRQRVRSIERPAENSFHG